jgi:uncharacterized RDD family membrane protein YckC
MPDGTVDELDSLPRLPLTLHYREHRVDAIGLVDSGALLDEAVGDINRRTLNEQLSNGLQIRRLKNLRPWAVVVLAVAILAFPLAAASPSTFKDWPVPQFVPSPLMQSLLFALSVAFLGAAGGFISGLLQAHSSCVTLLEYQETMLKLQLKPLVGSLVAVIACILLSWQVLPGINILNTGTYFLIAFLCGFSERYFLNMIDPKGTEAPSETVANSTRNPPGDFGGSRSGT